MPPDPPSVTVDPPSSPSTPTAQGTSTSIGLNPYLDIEASVPPDSLSVSVNPPSSPLPSTITVEDTTTSIGSHPYLNPTPFELLNPLFANQSLAFGCFSQARASVTFVAILFLSMTVMIESILWSYATNNLSPDEIMDYDFCKLSFLFKAKIFTFFSDIFVVYWHQNFGPMIIAWGALIIAYAKNRALRQLTKYKTFSTIFC